MSRKLLTQVSVLVLFILALIGTPISAQAGGVCGGTFVVEKGETLETIAATCGTTVAAITAANPGVSGTLSVGQVLIVPGSNAVVPSTPIPSGTITATVTNYNTYNYYNYPAQPVQPVYPVAGSNGTYVVQVGDTFSGIASRYGFSVQQLWAANPQIWNINYIYAGQAIYIPVYPSWGPLPAPAEAPVPLSYGTVPAGTKYGNVRLVDSTYSDIYVSLQGTTRDGVNVIREYPVSGSMTVKVPAGRYIYVAWVGGEKYGGQFNLGSGGDHTITFYDNKVTDQ